MIKKAIDFCKRYNLHENVASILIHLPEAYWYLFQVGRKDGDKITVSPGYYTYTSQKPKKVSLLQDIILAATRANIRYHCFNISKRRGVTGERICLKLTRNDNA